MSLISHFQDKFQSYLSPSPDIFHQMNHVLSGATVDLSRSMRGFGQAASSLISQKKVKISGGLGLVACAGLMWEAVTSKNVPAALAILSFVNANTILLLHGDPVRKEGEYNPQDKKFEFKDLFNKKDYPHESAGVFYKIGYAGMVLADVIRGDGVKFGAVGATNLVAGLITIAVREKAGATDKFKSAVLNLPGVKQVANLVETRPNLVGGLLTLPAYAHYAISDIQRNNGQVDISNAPALIASTASTVSWLYYMFTEKRGHVLKAKTEESPSEEAFDRFDDLSAYEHSPSNSEQSPQTRDMA